MFRRTAIIHAGTHKTGTTALQQACAANAEYLAANDVLYPSAGRIWGGHHAIAWQLNDDPRALAGDVLDDLTSELDDQRMRRVFLSSEDFEYLHADPARLKPLRDCLADAGYRTRVVIAFREPCGYMESLFDELHQHHGYDRTFDEYVDTVLTERRIVYGRWLFGFDRAAIVNGFEAVFGRRAVRVVDYDPADAVRPVLIAAGIPVGSLPSGGGRANQRTGPRSFLTDAQRIAVMAALR